MLTQLLGSKSRARIIATLMVKESHSAHLRDLVRTVGGSISSVQREVERLEDIGLVTSTIDGAGRRQVKLVDDHPFAGPLAGLVAADPRAQYGVRVTQVPHLDPHVAEALEQWVDAIVTSFDPIRIVLFGSQARGTAREDSDVDLLVVLPEVPEVNKTAVALMDVMAPFALGADVVPTDPRRMALSGKRMDSVVRDALEEGVVVYERSA